MHPPAGQEVMMIDVDWRQPVIDYLSEQKIPSNKNLAEQLIRRAKSYVLVRDKLYRRGASSGVLMKCVPRHLKAKKSTTRGTSTNFVGSTPSLHDYPGGSSLHDYIRTPPL
jgi:hypothetical protein